MRLPHSIYNNWSKTTAFLIFVSMAIAQGELSWGQTATTQNGVAVVPIKKSGTTQKEYKYLRMKKNSQDEPASLQTSITRFKSGDTIVDLIGAVHIGERSYYQRLNKQFELYDVVLYELVAPEGTRIPKNGKRKSSGNPLSILQSSMQKMLGLESQLALIDYQKKNFEHADMSPADIGKKMEERGETAFSIGMSALSEMMKNQKKMASQLADNDGLASSLSNEGLFDLMGNPLKLKKMLASQFTANGVMESGMGETLNRMLIDDRNAAAMKVLKRQLKSGKKHIAIFYGAAHMPDFQERLAAEHNLQPTKQVWLDAWDLTKAPAKSTSPMGLMMDILRQME